MARKTEDTMVQSAVWLPRDLHQRLKHAGGKRGMGEEIRQRLESSFATEKASANPKTQEFLDDISYVAGEAATYCGDPFEDAFAFEVLNESVESLLTAVRPKGNVVLNPDYSDYLALTLGSDLSPKDVSRIFVSDVRRARAKRADERKR